MKSLVDVVNLFFWGKPEKIKLQLHNLLNSVLNYLLYCERERTEHSLKPQLPGTIAPRPS